MSASILEARGLVKCFGGITATDDVSLNVEAGSIVGLIGPNGAGKTTLFNLLAGYHTPDQGSIVFQGMEIAGLRPPEICRRGLARTFQTTKPFMECTVRYNVAIGALSQASDVSQAYRLADQILERVGLSHISENDGHTLTVPDRKLLEIGRALATGCTLLLLDEPLAGLNTREKADTVETIRSINGDGVSIVIVEHDMASIVALANHIVLLNRGGILIEGDAESVTSDPRAIAAYLGDDYVAA